MTDPKEDTRRVRDLRSPANHRAVRKGYGVVGLLMIALLIVIGALLLLLIR